MTIKLLKDIVTSDGEKLSVGAVLTDAEADVSEMLDLVASGAAQDQPVEMMDMGAPRAELMSKKLVKGPKELIEFCENAVRNKWGYVWGGRGKVYDESERDYLYKTYKTSKYDKTYYYTTQWNRWKGVKVCDCSGMLEAFSGLNRTANSFYGKCVAKGTISSMPDTVGLLLFRYSSAQGRMVHIGVYAGSGKGMESKDSASGVVKTNVSARGWTHWGKADFIDYSSAGSEPQTPGAAFELGRELSYVSPYMRGSDVTGVQKALIGHGFGVGKSGADGIYGKDSYNAIRSFQQADALKVDGIVGKKTVAALGGVWIGK